MTKVEVTEKLAQKLGVPIARAEQMVASVEETFREVLLGGGKIRLQGFGTFGTRLKPQRKVRNQKNKKWYVTERHQGAYFKPSRELKRLAQNAKPAVTGSRVRPRKRPRLPAKWDPKPEDLFAGVSIPYTLPGEKQDTGNHPQARPAGAQQEPKAVPQTQTQPPWRPPSLQESLKGAPAQQPADPGPSAKEIAAQARAMAAKIRGDLKK